MASMHSRGRGRRTINEINMVPFIDVMLVLLIIFMVTAPMITPSMVDLPSVGKAAKQPDKVVQVVIQKDDSIELMSDGSTQIRERGQSDGHLAARRHSARGFVGATGTLNGRCKTPIALPFNRPSRAARGVLWRWRCWRTACCCWP
jgi:biopolymer transport protein TolR